MFDDDENPTGFANRSYPVDPQMGHRTAELTVALTRPDGTPVPPGTEVTVSQRSHRFPFGCIGFEFVEFVRSGAVDTVQPGRREGATLPSGVPQDLAHRWLEIFNSVTLPFYWSTFEPEPGHPRTEDLRAAAQWFVDRRCTVKGHPLTWQTRSPSWLTKLSVGDIEAAQRGRIRREVSDFAGVIDLWDVINEVVIMPVFDKYDSGARRLARHLGRTGVIRMAFDEARAANPSAVLLLNDYDMSTAYECLIEGCLEAGIRIDALGLQSHMHQGYWGEERTLAVLERFARYGLPLHFTENTLLSGHLMPMEITDNNDYQPEHWPSTPDGEARQADELVRHYRTLMSHPAVEAITYWGLTDAGSWLGAPVGLVRTDGTVKPSYEALHSLIKDEWWLAPTVTTADPTGRISVRGFLGDYEISGPAGSAVLTLDRAGRADVSVRLTP